MMVDGFSEENSAIKDNRKMGKVYKQKRRQREGERERERDFFDKLIYNFDINLTSVSESQIFSKSGICDI